MKTIITTVLFHLLAQSSVLVLADEPRPWWAYDDSSPGTIRVVDFHRAHRVEAAGGSVRLFTEKDGKLAKYWESEDVNCVKRMKQQLEWAPSVFLPIGNDTFVRKNTIASAIFKKDPAGKEVATLYDISGLELATVSDAAVIEKLKIQMKLQKPTRAKKTKRGEG